jgi:hypothetical protein
MEGERERGRERERESCEVSFFFFSIPLSPQFQGHTLNNFHSYLILRPDVDPGGRGILRERHRDAGHGVRGALPQLRVGDVGPEL